MAKSSIVWALDPSMKKRASVRNVAKAISSYRKEAVNPVYPVSVLTPADFGWASDMVPVLRDNSRAVMKAKIKPIVQRSGLGAFETPTVLIRELRSNKLASDALLRFAQDREAELIVTGSGGKRGIERFRAGSFVESLMSASEIPLLVVGPKAKVPAAIKTLLVPTDFSPSSKKALTKAIRIAKRQGAKLILFHLMETIPVMTGISHFGAADPRILAMSLDNEEKIRKQLGDLLVKGVRKQGVDCEFSFERRNVGLAEAFNRAVRVKRADAIVLTCARGRLNQTFFGQVGRELIASCRRPVFVLHG